LPGRPRGPVSGSSSLAPWGRRTVDGMTRQQLPAPKVTMSDAEWKERLSPAEYRVLRRADTERPWTGEYVETRTAGVYRCRACGAELFRSDTKFDSHCGWPSFYAPTEADNVLLREDVTMGMCRVEVLCGSFQS